MKTTTAFLQEDKSELHAYSVARFALLRVFCLATHTADFGTCDDDENQFCKWLVKKGLVQFTTFEKYLGK